MLLGVSGAAAHAAAAAYGLDVSGLNPVDFVRTFDFKALLESVAEQVDGLGSLGYLYFAAVYIAAEVLALPAVPLTASAGYLFGALPGTATVLVSATIAAGVSFLIGRTLLRKYIEDMAADNKTFRAIDAVGREGFKVVLLLRSARCCPLRSPTTSMASPPLSSSRGLPPPSWASRRAPSRTCTPARRPR